jgi:hypothetical protein
VSSTPSHVVLSPSSKTTNLNLLDFSKVGLSTLSDSSAFKKIQYYSKVSPQSLYASTSSLSNSYSKLSDLYLKSSSTTNSYNYGTLRQHNYTVSASNQYKQNLLDNKSVDLLLEYNYGINNVNEPTFTNENKSATSLPSSYSTNTALLSVVDTGSSSNSFLHSSIESPTSLNSANSTDDSKGHNNSIKYVDYSKIQASSYQKHISDLQPVNQTGLPYLSDDNTGNSHKFKDNKSANSSFLSSEKNIRLIDNVNPTKLNHSLSESNNNLEEIVSNSIGESVLPSSYNLYSLSTNS